MLLKYLNELDRAVQAARLHPGLEQFSRCAECVDVLRDYLRGQMEPVRRRGTEIMDTLLPEQFEDWMAMVGAARNAEAQQRYHV
ncbi:hypothetical protein A167_01043 [Alcanivorax sp. S71-1-4]|uniref:Uncharacterized protein n=1 Tax=Isoalcanivorax pacificus W11-5 TaxID=391936 RepID=A0A0B4XKE6_9GAMM|nr:MULTISPECIES: hypothetical protein [Alcanivoracaceae]AJD47561.1 hypothetical protein S7S_05715 [Isoalcanivorax pacificus W11-5]KAF0810362.1 hypothetical protein A167_01043 [Alcanivorax sp. S71-1-4]